MTGKCRFLIAAALPLLISCATTAFAATSSGNWPCIQRKVPEISAAAVWRGPELTPGTAAWRDNSSVANLVQLLAARRTTDAEAIKAIAEFSQAAGEKRKELLMAVMAGLLESVNRERAEVIAGLERFGDGQKQMAVLLRNENAELAKLRSSASSDAAALTQRVEQLNWNLRIFNERQKSLSYVCEVPVLIEQRLFALSKKLFDAFEGN